jgi:hypothetical protein
MLGKLCKEPRMKLHNAIISLSNHINLASVSHQYAYLDKKDRSLEKSLKVHEVTTLRWGALNSLLKT